MHSVAIRAPKGLTECRRFFLEPEDPKHRQYEALRAYFLEGRPSPDAARAFGYTPGSFRVLCHQFRRDPDPHFFVAPKLGPRAQPKKSAAHERVVEMRKRNYSVYDISQALAEEGLSLSATAVREVLAQEGFAPLPRRLDEERPTGPHPTIEAAADARSFSLAPRQFMTRCGGIFLFLPDLVRLGFADLGQRVGLPGSKMIPASYALRSLLALKLWGIERKSHVMALVADQGLALFSGLNVTPKKSYLSEYSSRITHSKTMGLLSTWHGELTGEQLFRNQSFNLDFHSVPYYGEHPVVERHYVSSRSRRQPSILVFLAQDADAHTFCYSNADLRKGDEAEEVFRFLSFWEKTHGERPRHIVFDSKLTTYAGLARLDQMGVTFITLRRRTPALLQEVAQLPRSAWRRIELDVVTRKYRHPRVYEQKVTLAGCRLRQLFILDLGHDEPTILLTNTKRKSVKQLVTRYAQRMLIENAISDAVRFFHIDALTSAVGLKVDFDMALLVLASALYRLVARRMRGYADAQARQVFRDIIDVPANVVLTDQEVVVELHRRAHLPIILSSGLLNAPTPIPWWGGRPLRLTTFTGTAA
jgi:hypothetical protein